MAVKKEFSTAKDFRKFIEQNHADFNDLYVKEVYNLGNAEYQESPLFLYSGYSIIMVYLLDGRLTLNIYDKDFFIQHIRSGVFREDSDSEEFYYFNFTSSKLINDYVQSIDVKENESETIDKIDLTFKSGRNLHIEHSNVVEGTMCSYLSN